MAFEPPYTQGGLPPLDGSVPWAGRITPAKARIGLPGATTAPQTPSTAPQTPSTAPQTPSTAPQTPSTASAITQPGYREMPGYGDNTRVLGKASQPGGKINDFIGAGNGQPNTPGSVPNTVSSAGMMAPSFNAEQKVRGALNDAASRGDWASVENYYANMGQGFGGKTAEQIKGTDMQSRVDAVMGMPTSTFGEMAQKRSAIAALRQGVQGSAADARAEQAAARLAMSQDRNEMLRERSELDAARFNLSVAKEGREAAKDAREAAKGPAGKSLTSLQELEIKRQDARIEQARVAMRGIKRRQDGRFIDATGKVLPPNVGKELEKTWAVANDKLSSELR